MKRSIQLSAFGLATLLISSTTAGAEDYLYEVSSGTITITGYTGPGGVVSVPSRINGLPVASIGQMAFRDCSTVTRVRLPEGVTTISDWAFWGCTALEDLELPDSLTTIGGYAFQGCVRMGRFAVPGQVTAIAPGTFGDCIGLATVSLPDRLVTIGEGAFGGSGLTNITLPDSVYDLGDRAFWYCTNLSEVTLPGSLTNIGRMAFFNCTALTRLVVPGGVSSIRDNAFENCENLGAVCFQGNAPRVEDGAFANVSRATLYWLPGTVGWADNVSGRPTAPWVLPYPVVLNLPPAFGLQNDAFGFRVSWATNSALVIEACGRLEQPTWSPVSTNTLVNGWFDYKDSEWTRYSNRFYRARQR